MAADLSAQAESLFMNEEYEDALAVFERMQASGVDMRPYRVFRSQCYLALDDLENSLRELNRGLSELSLTPDLLAQKRTYKSLVLQKVQILKAKNSVTEYRKAIEEMTTNPYSRKLRMWAEDTLKELANGDLTELQEKLVDHPEYKEFVKHYQETTKEGDLWHVVSTEWIRKWLGHLQGEGPPGPISNSTVAEKPSQKRLIDPEASKGYTNVCVKTGLAEMEDFQVVPKAAYSLLVSKYDHDDTEIRRYSIATDIDGSQTTVEIWLKRIQVLLDSTVKELFISRKESVSDLKEKVNRITGRKGAITRLWKKKPTEAVSAVLDTLSKLTTTKSVLLFREALLLEDSKELESADIADEDVVIVETLSGTRQWLLQPEQPETCKGCGRTGALTACGGCRAVKYCSASCQRQHFSAHKEECKRKQKKGRAGLVGLQNLGNTCFMNSAIQCLSHTEALTGFLLEEKYKADLNKKNPIGTGGRLVLAYVTLLQNLWLDPAPVQSPWELKRMISTFAPQFSGYQQHDSHELLSYLLDGIHEDLNRVKKKPYTTPSEDSDREEEEVADEFWQNHLKRNQSVIVDLMHSQYKSTLVCPSCKKVSVTFDPFLTFTLQIPNKETKKWAFVFVPHNPAETVKELVCSLALTTTVAEVRHIVSNEFKVAAELLLPVALEHKRFKGTAGDDMELSDLKQYEVVLYEMQDEALHPICVNITETSSSGVVRPATWPRIIFLHSDSTATYIYSLVKSLCAALLGDDSHPVSLRLVNRSRVKTSYFMFQSRVPCCFCSSKDCQNCELPKSDEVTLDTLQSKAEDRLEFELRHEHLFPRIEVDTRSHKSLKAAAANKSQISLLDCLLYSSRPEVLSRDNAWFCGACKQEVQATKTLQIYKSAEVLIFHLKRFRPRYFEKLATVVDFPLEGLDMREFVLGPERSRQVYDLYAVSNHFGSMLGGHYTAFVRSGDRWFDMDDSSVSEIRSPTDVVSSAAYMLFYRRRP